jgi:hypothetical protein
MNKTKRYRLARTSADIARETLVKAVIILVVLLVMQLEACEAKAATDAHITEAFFCTHFAIRRPWLQRNKNNRRAGDSCNDREKIRKKQKAKRNNLTKIKNIRDTNAAD